MRLGINTVTMISDRRLCSKNKLTVQHKNRTCDWLPGNYLGKIEALRHLVILLEQMRMRESSCRAIWPYAIEIPQHRSDNNYIIDIKFLIL